MDLQKFPKPLMHAIGFSELIRFDTSTGNVRVRYTARPEFAHSDGAVVQGGFITAWLDSAMAFAVSARDPQAQLASLELKVSFLDRVGVDNFEVEARILRWGRSVIFLEAELLTMDGRLMAKASSTGKLLRAS